MKKLIVVLALTLLTGCSEHQETPEQLQDRIKRAGQEQTNYTERYGPDFCTRHVKYGNFAYYCLDCQNWRAMRANGRVIVDTVTESHGKTSSIEER